METIEMDLMQAQIGELTAELARLQNQVKNGGGTGGGVVTIELTDGTQTETGFTATSPMTAVEIRGLLEQGKTVIINISIAIGDEYMALKWIPVLYSSTEDTILAYTISTIETSNDMISEIQYLRLIIEDDDATVTPITAAFS